MSQKFRAYKKDSKYGIAIVTGGSSGIGNSIIEQIGKLDLAPVVFNLSRQKPSTFYDVIEGVHVDCDLSDREQRKTAFTKLERLIEARPENAKILLVNNAGFGLYGKAFTQDPAQHLEVIEVNVAALVELTVRLLPRIKQNGGAIMNIASTAAFQPTPYLATYGAAKSFVLDWTLALNEELRYDKAHAIAICPGPTRTNFFQRAGLPPRHSPSGHSHTSESVAKTAIAALIRGESHIVIGLKNKLLAALPKLLPRATMTYLARQAIKRYRANRDS